MTMMQSVPGAVATGYQFTGGSNLPDQDPVATAPGTDLITPATHAPGNRQYLNSFTLENHVTRAGSGGNDGENILLPGNHDIDHRHTLMRQAGFKNIG